MVAAAVGSPAVRRVARRMPLLSRDDDDEVLERMGATGDGDGGSGRVIPAASDTADAPSMYFSIRRSLFQFIWRNNRAATLAYMH